MIYKHLYWSLEPCLNVLILLNLRLDTLLTNEDDDDDDDDYDDDKVYSAILLYTITVNYTGPCKQVDHNVVTWLVKTDSTNTCITWIACLFYSINVCKYYRFQYSGRACSPWRPLEVNVGLDLLINTRQLIHFTKFIK